jgi:hypothetical protein
MGAMTFHSLVGALIFLGLGLIELAVVSRSLYPALRWRFEKAKTTQEQGVNPKTVMLIVKFQSLVLMPIIGFVLGDRMMKSILG